MDREKVRSEAKELLEKFAKSLEKIKNISQEQNIQQEIFEREENGKSCENFKSLLLENAPNKNEDFILTEKGAWK